jgi:hypothetical protein
MNSEPTHFDHTAVVFINSFLDLTSVAERKSLVLLARAQQAPKIVTPDDTDSLSNLAQRPLQNFLRRAALRLCNNAIDLLIHHVSLFFSPALSGYLVNYLYHLPMQTFDIDTTKESSFIAEFEVTQRERRNSVINWKPILIRGFQHQELNPEIPANEPLMKAIHEHMVAFRQSYKFRTIFPETSKRGVSHDTQHEFRAIIDKEDLTLSPYSDITPSQLLQVYLQIGKVTEGVSELRQKWYPTGLKPRTYFAQGGTAYFSSLYLKTFFNTLADTFKFTNRFQRVETDRLQLQRQDGHFLIYDYHNFTSNFSEQYHFLMELAEFFRGCPVILLGPQLARTTVSLGSLIEEYATICNDQPAFKTGTGSPFQFSDTLYHIQAGFLGVFGNLMTCTVPHGLVARAISTSDDSTCTAGDDGVIEPLSSDQQAYRSLELLGEFSREKCFDSRHPSIFLKLPFHTRDNVTYTSKRLEFPNLNFATFGDMDPRFTHLSDLSVGDRRLTVYRQVVRFLRSLSDPGFVIHDYEYGIISAIINGLTKKMRLRNDGRGDMSVTFRTRFQGRITQPALPYLTWTDLTNVDYMRYFPRSNPNELIRLRRRGDTNYGFGTEIEEGDIYWVPGGKVWRYLESGGYIRYLPEPIDMEEESDFMYIMAKDVDEYRETGPELRKVEVLRDVSAYDMKVLYEHPEAAYIDAIEVIQGIDSHRNRKRLRRAFSDSRYIDLDDPEGFDVVALDYGDEFGRSDSYWSDGLIKSNSSM